MPSRPHLFPYTRVGVACKGKRGRGRAMPPRAARARSPSARAGGSPPGRRRPTAQRDTVREDLAGVVEVREPVDDRHARAGGEIGDALVEEGARHDQVDPTLEVAGDVAGRLPLAEADVAGGEVDGGAAELRHAD